VRRALAAAIAAMALAPAGASASTAEVAVAGQTLGVITITDAGATITAERDSVFARDGRRDHVACGGGRDTARIDAKDRVRACERVRTHRYTPSR